MWLDCVDNYTHSETWLELRTNDIDSAVAHLQANGTVPQDELEQIPGNMHWITDPAGTVFIFGQNDTV